MGATLVAQVLAHWTHVSDRAFRVLVRMAVTALDTPSKGKPAGIYHAGRDLLAMSFRSEKGSDETRYRAVKRALAELSEEGAIRHVQQGWAGHNAVYRLTLEPKEKGGQISPPKGGPTSPPKGGLSGTEWGARGTPPRNQEEPLKERDEEEVVDVPTTSHPPLEAAPPEERTGVVVEMFPKKPQGSTRRSNAEIEAATARRLARRAEHLAQIAAEARETS
jgi:hypothetical protein